MLKLLQKTARLALRRGERIRNVVVAGPSPVEESSCLVWQWTRPKYRRRAVGLLLLNVLLFAVLGCFTYWIRTGEAIPFLNAYYWHNWWKTFSPIQEDQITLIDFLFYPIPMEQVPMMMVIGALVLASLTAIPILVSMLYGFAFALIFTAMVGFVAMAPWLAITVTFCCGLARWRPLRFSFHYATALVAMLPLVGYYVLATRNASDLSVLPLVATPKFYVPFVLALIVACVVIALVLTIARMVRYRPGAIAPLMGIMVALPVILFETHVGRDELHYRLYESRYGPDSKIHFVNEVDASLVIDRIAQRRWEELDKPTVSLESVREQVALALELQLASVQSDYELEQLRAEASFAQEQDEAAEECDRFCRRFSHSAYVPNALYLKGRALDMRVDVDLFHRTAVLRYYDDFPSQASESVWRTLASEYPRHPVASVAFYRLAILSARERDVDRAIEWLDELNRIFAGTEIARSTGSNPRLREMLNRKPTSSSLQIDPALAVREGAKLKDLLVRHRDPEQKDAPLRRLMSMDPRHPQYRENLRLFLAEIPAKYPFTTLGNELRIRLAASEPSRSRRIAELSELVREFSGSEQSHDLVRACYELGSALRSDSQPAEAAVMFERAIQSGPDSPWAVESNRALVSLNLTDKGR